MDLQSSYPYHYRPLPRDTLIYAHQMCTFSVTIYHVYDMFRSWFRHFYCLLGATTSYFLVVIVVFSHPVRKLNVVCSFKFPIHCLIAFFSCRTLLHHYQSDLVGYPLFCPVSNHRCLSYLPLSCWSIKSKIWRLRKWQNIYIKCWVNQAPQSLLK